MPKNPEARLSTFGLRILVALLFLLPLAIHAQSRPYVGYVYPAGGKQGTTFRIRLGGQSLEDVSSVMVTGSGVTAKVAEYYRRLNNQELQLLNEQVRILKQAALPESARSQLMSYYSNDLASAGPAMMSPETNRSAAASATNEVAAADSKREAARKLIDRIEARTLGYVPNPASASIATLVVVEVTVASDAEPGEREIRLRTLRGVSNPLPFYVGQLPEVSKKPMVSATQQVLGKEAQALRKRLPGDDRDRIAVPCTVNGQIASSEVNRYRFAARQGQRLVITTLGRQLVPFIADAVPGWFQPVLALYDADGKEVAYCDDYRFNPDPTIFYEVPKDGEYEFAIHDSLYRGREDFVYRITIGELPFITSIFPLGGRVDTPVKPEMIGWNLEGAELTPPATNAGPGAHWLAASQKGLVSNRVPFSLDTLPEIIEREPNNTLSTAQKVALPVIINGRIGKPDDWDVYQFIGGSNDLVVAEVMARRLGSPLDSGLKLTDAAGNVLAFNDDCENLTAGLNTHQADSYLIARLPADGPYYIHLGDTARQGGEEYGYRLRLSAPQPDFELRVAPSSLSLRSKATGALTIYAQRKDGFAGPIKLSLKDPPPGFSAAPITLSITQAVARLNVRTTLTNTPQPITLTILGSAKFGDQELIREAVPAEDRMQAFLWRHLVPAKELAVLVFDPNYQAPPKRVVPTRVTSLIATILAASTNVLTATNNFRATNTLAGVTLPALANTNAVGGTNLTAAAKPKFTKQQVTAGLRQLKLLFDEGMFTDDFYEEKVAAYREGE